jgi:hypothetical protein
MLEVAGPGAGGAATSSAVLGDLIAVGRGLGSTWAGLAPAEGPVVAAMDPLAGPRRWFAFVPGGSARAGDAPPVIDGGTVDAFEAGVALTTGPVALDDARAIVARFASGEDDVTLYPIDD